MVDKQAGDEDLLKLQVPCPVSSTTLEQLAKCVNSNGSMELSMVVLLPMLQLGEAIKVCSLALALGGHGSDFVLIALDSPCMGRFTSLLL